MRIAFVSDAAYPWSVGGLEAVEGTEAVALAQRHDLHFFSLRWPGMKPNFVYKNVHYHTFHDIRHDRFYRHGRRSIREAGLFTLYTLTLFRYRFDVIQVNQFPYFQIPIVKAYCILTGCKMVIDVVEVWDRSYWVKYLASKNGGRLASWFSGWALRMADAYIANSSTTAENLAMLGIDGDKVNVFSPVVDDITIRSIKQGKRSNTIIFSGRLIKEKRFDKWLNVVKEVSKRIPSLKAVLIGEGPESENIKKMIVNYGLGKTVEFRKFYPESKIKELYSEIRSAGLLLNMSEREGLSIIGLQSLALGTPVVLPDYSPIPNEVKEMCVVEGERDIANTVVKILRSSNKKDYIRNVDKLKAFSKSNVNDFYNGMFRKLGIE